MAGLDGQLIGVIAGHAHVDLQSIRFGRTGWLQPAYDQVGSYDPNDENKRGKHTDPEPPRKSATRGRRLMGSQ